MSADGVRAERKPAEFWWSAVAFLTAVVTTLGSFDAFRFSNPETPTFLRALPAIAVGFVLLVRAMRNRPTIPGVAFALIPVFGILLAHGASGDQILMPLLSALLFAPIFLIPGGGYDLHALKAGARFGISAALVTVSTITILMPASTIGECRGDKCSVWGMALGALGTGNALGVALAAAGAISLLAVQRILPFISVALGSYLLTDLTSSRSAFVGWVIGTAIAVAYRLGKRQLATRLATLAVAFAVVVLPLIPWRGDEFTGRSSLWAYAFSLWRDSSLFGYGASFWVGGDGSDGIDRNYSSHSLLPEMLISVGVVGAAAFAVTLVIASRGRSSIENARYATAVIGIILGLSLLEVFSAPGRVYLSATALPFALLASMGWPTRPADRLLEVDGASQSTPRMTARVSSVQAP